MDSHRPSDPVAAPDRTAQVLAVVLLVAMIVLSLTGKRDDKAWKMWTEPLVDWFEETTGL
ncbi:MAG: hypothetical protein H6741_31530 [Alphaproteobacteria bacterium]|nr:hypothetical protein [Alphaproteobacteria bacterium]